MAGGDGPISDRAIVSVLRPFVRATRPVLAGLREGRPVRAAQPRAAGRPADADGEDRRAAGQGARRARVGAGPGHGGVGGEGRAGPLPVVGAARRPLHHAGRRGPRAGRGSGPAACRCRQDGRRRGPGPGAGRDRRGARRARRGRGRGAARRGAVRRDVSTRTARCRPGDDAAADARAAELTGELGRAGEAAHAGPGRRRDVAAGPGAVRRWRASSTSARTAASTTRRSPCCPSSGWSGSTSGEWSGLKRAAREGGALARRLGPRSRRPPGSGTGGARHTRAAS